MYYNHNVKKSHTSVFKGKEREYNEYVLRSLIYGQKTTMEVARFIANETEKHRKTIFSIIARKRGALNRLSEREFVERLPNKKWHLTFKGTATALTLVNDLEMIVRMIRKDLQVVDLRRKFKFLRLILGRFFKEQMIEDLVNWFQSEDYWQALRRKTEQLRDTGVNIEDMTEKEFTYTVLPQLMMDKSAKKFFKTLSANNL